MPAIRVQSITSLDLPELQAYRTLRRPHEHFKEGILVAEGEKVVRRLLESGLAVVSILLTPEWHERLRPGGVLDGVSGATAYVAEKGLLESIVGYNLHQGIMAVAKIPAEPSLDEALAALPTPHLIVAMDGLVNAENVGIIVRNCAAFGVDAILVGETSGSPYLRRAVRNSMGAVFHSRIVHVPRLVESLRKLHAAHGTRIVGAHPGQEGSIYGADLRGNICLVFGNEGEGLSREVLEGSTDLVSIPMANRVDSLNVSNASAVFLFEAARQRTAR
jgi:tRNA G18 (ribose-2'-O)-methylase SpoU